MIYPTLTKTNARQRGPIESKKLNLLLDGVKHHLDLADDAFTSLLETYEENKREYMTRRFVETPFIVGKTDPSTTFVGFAYLFPLAIQETRIILDFYAVVKSIESYDPPLRYDPSGRCVHKIHQVAYLDTISTFNELDMTTFNCPIETQIYKDIELVNHMIKSESEG